MNGTRADGAGAAQVGGAVSTELLAQRSENEISLGLLRQPSQILYGPGQRHQLPYLLSDLGSRVLFTTDARMATTDEFAVLRDAVAAAGLDVYVFDRVDPELPRENIVDIVDEFGRAEIDAIVGIGGGSCLDAAKVASVMLTNGGDVRDYYGEFLVPAPGVPVITIPTTGGTGAEITCISVVFDAERGMKVGVASPHLGARIALVDPELTLTAPRGLTAVTGADALSHLIESYTARAKNPTPEQIRAHLYAGKNLLTDIYVRHGLHLINRSLVTVYEEPDNLAARSDVSLAATIAGLGINTTGTAGAHAIQSPIGALTHTPHGAGVGALLPYIMRFNLPARVREFAEIGAAFGIDAGSEYATAQAAIVRAEELLAALDIPTTLEQLGLKREDFGYVADQALLATRLTANNPRDLDHAGIVKILERGYAGDRSWWGE